MSSFLSEKSVKPNLQARFLVHSLLCLVSCFFSPLNLYLFPLNFSALFNFRSKHIIHTIFSATCCSAQPLLLFGYPCPLLFMSTYCCSSQPPFGCLCLLLFQSTSYWKFPPTLLLPSHTVCLPQAAVALVNLLLVVPTYWCSSQCHNGCLNLLLL
jgi:hypothetical protein